MKQFFNSALLLLVFFAALTACEFEPSGENFREIAGPDTTKLIQVDLSPFETQYIFTKYTNVNYNLNTFGLKIYNVEFFVDQQSIHQGSEAEGFFVFNPGLYGRGSKILTMVITTNSNTGSLADLIGAEALVYSQSWNLVLDGDAPDPVEITSIINDDGVLRLNWSEYKRINFQKYIVYRKFSRNSEPAEIHEIAEYANPKLRSCNDLSYIGGEATYWVVVQASDQSVESTRKEVSYDYPKLDTAWVAGDSARFVWRKNIFPKAFQKVTISTMGYSHADQRELFSTEVVNDTSVVLKGLQLGLPATYTFANYSRNEIGLFDQKDQLRTNLTFSVGKKYPGFGRMLCSNTENSVYLWQNDRISKLDMDSRKIVSSGNCPSFYTWFISDYDGDIYTNSPFLNRFNKNNLNDSQVFYPENFQIHSFWTTTSISANNRIAGPIGLYIGYYDITEQRLIFTEKNTNIGWSIFSPDGKYAFNIQYRSYADKKVIDLYEVTETGLTKIGSLPEENYSTNIWVPEQAHKIMTIAGYQMSTANDDQVKVSFWDAPAFKKEFEFQAKAGYMTNIDVFSKQIAFWKREPNYYLGRNLFIYNYETGKLIQELNVKSWFDMVSIFRSQVLTSDGMYYDYSKN